MKYNNTIDIVKLFAKALLAPEALTTSWSIPNNSKKSGISGSSNDLDLNNNMNNSVYSQDNSGNKEYNESAPLEESKSYNNKSNGYYNKQQNTSSDPQGVIDSITQEITPVRLQQAIILSEIVGKPRSKTRKKRRF